MPGVYPYRNVVTLFLLGTFEFFYVKLIFNFMPICSAILHFSGTDY